MKKSELKQLIREVVEEVKKADKEKQVNDIIKALQANRKVANQLAAAVEQSGEQLEEGKLSSWKALALALLSLGITGNSIAKAAENPSAAQGIVQQVQQNAKKNTFIEIYKQQKEDVDGKYEQYKEIYFTSRDDADKEQAAYISVNKAMKAFSMASDFHVENQEVTGELLASNIKRITNLPMPAVKDALKQVLKKYPVPMPQH